MQESEETTEIEKKPKFKPKSKVKKEKLPNIFECTFHESDKFSGIFTNLDEILTESNIDVNDEGMSMGAPDVSHICYVTWQLNLDAFKEFNVAKNLSFGIAPKSLIKMLKVVKLDKQFQIIAQDEDSLTINSKNPNTGKKMALNLKLMNITSEHWAIPEDAEYHSTIVMSCAEFKATCDCLHAIGEVMKIHVTTEGVVFSCNGDEGSCEIDFPAMFVPPTQDGDGHGDGSGGDEKSGKKLKFENDKQLLEHKQTQDMEMDIDQSSEKLDKSQLPADPFAFDFETTESSSSVKFKVKPATSKKRKRYDDSDSEDEKEQQNANPKLVSKIKNKEMAKSKTKTQAQAQKKSKINASAKSRVTHAPIAITCVSETIVKLSLEHLRKISKCCSMSSVVTLRIRNGELINIWLDFKSSEDVNIGHIRFILAGRNTLDDDEE